MCRKRSLVGLTGRSADPERVTQERRRNHGRNLILTAAEAAEAVLEVEVVAGVVVKLSGFTVAVLVVVAVLVLMGRVNVGQLERFLD